MQETSIVEVSFMDDAPFQCVRENDDVYVNIKRVCENLGVDYSAQLKRLKEKPWATVAIKTTVGNDEKTREMSMINLDSLPMWLATISSNRVSEDIRPKLIRYQIEAAQVLRDHFFGHPKQEQEQTPILYQIDQKKALGDQWEKQEQRLLEQAEQARQQKQQVRSEIPALIEQATMEYYRSLVRHAGLSASHEVSLPDASMERDLFANLPAAELPLPVIAPMRIRDRVVKASRRLAYLLYPDVPETDVDLRFTWAWDKVLTEFSYRGDKINIKRRAANAGISYIEYADEHGYLPELLSLIQEMILEASQAKETLN
jgi:ElaB/YqjD/DUF883 family membrane-anchored ribosome-binding protein